MPRSPWGPAGRRLLFLFFLLPLASTAQQLPADLQSPRLSEKVLIAADRVDYDRERELLHLSGNVVIEQPPWRLTAQEVTVDLTTRLARATGEVRIVQGEGEQAKTLLAAETAEVDLSGRSGWMADAQLAVPWEGGEIRLGGQRLERLDENRYRIEHGSMTPCQCPEGKAPDWEITARQLQAETEKRVTLSRAQVKVRGRTVFYLPYFSYPIGTQRRTGFLLPELDLSSLDGFEVTVPFYWVLHPSADLTLYPHYIADRGFEPGAEFRYNLGPPGEGRAAAYAIRDLDADAERWSFAWQNRSSFPRGYSLLADLNLVSDNEYIADFDHDLGRRYDRFLESRLIAGRHRPNSLLTAEFSVFDDLQGGDLRSSPFGPDRDEAMVQRLPEVRYTRLTSPLLGPLQADLGLRAAHYQTADPELSSHDMVDVYPRLVLPLRWFDAVEMAASAGYHGLAYRPDPIFGDPSLRGQAEAAAEITSAFERIYAGRPEGFRYRHLVSPTLFAYYSSDPGQAEDTFFPLADPRPETGYYGLQLKSLLYRKPNREGDPGPAREAARFELTQVYDWTAGNYPDLRLEGQSALPRGLRLQLDSYFSWDQGQWTRVEPRVLYRDPLGNEYRLGYRWDTGEIQSPLFHFTTRPGRDLMGGVTLGLGPRLKADYRGHYSLEHGRFNDQALAFDYAGKQKCWGLRLYLADRLRPDQPDKPHDYSAGLNFSLEK